MHGHKTQSEENKTQEACQGMTSLDFLFYPKVNFSYTVLSSIQPWVPLFIQVYDVLGGNTDVCKKWKSRSSRIHLVIKLCCKAKSFGWSKGGFIGGGEEVDSQNKVTYVEYA